MSGRDNRGTLLLSTWAPRPLAHQFTELARAHERSVAAELRRAIRAHVEREQPARGDEAA